MAADLPQVLSRLTPANVPMTPGEGTVITVMSASGGCGSTTLAFNLANEIAVSGGQPLLLIDMDWYYGAAAPYLGIEGRYGVAAVLTHEGHIDAHLVQVIHRIATGVGRRIDESSPMLDARLIDGSRVNAIIPPLALDGAALSIRRFGTIPIDVHKLLQLGTLMPEAATFLEACVRCKMNILISGGTGAGKTTLLNVLSSWIPSGERVVTIEDAAELQLQGEHIVRLESRPPNIEGKGKVGQSALLRNSLRMRPDRIIIGEVRGDETFAMLQAMNTGHEGSMTSTHANPPRDALRRIENMVSMAGLNYPIHAIRQQIASALHILVHLERVPGGRRKVVKIVEVTGTEGDLIRLSDIFKFVQAGIASDGHAEGHFEMCGVRPQVADRLKACGVTFPDSMFLHRVLGTASTELEG